MQSVAPIAMIAPALADVVAKRADNGLGTGMSAADMVPAPSTPEDPVSRNSESISGD